jgi:hypothetical protein
MRIVSERPSRSDVYPWYDSVWLGEYARAKATIAAARPERLEAFVDAFEVFRTAPSFRERRLARVFDDRTMAEIRRAVKSLRPTDLELHEARAFGRFVVHDHPLFGALQEQLVPLMSETVGEPVESAYSFLSLYGARGVCPPHLDSPQAKWTLDLCLDQSAPWPIHVSQVCAWPEAAADAALDRDWERRITESSSLRFASHVLAPGEAIVFSGSSQWHYRDPIPRSAGRTFAELLFFHFIPAGTAALLPPDTWPIRFGVPELRSARPTAGVASPAAG